MKLNLLFFISAFLFVVCMFFRSLRASASNYWHTVCLFWRSVMTIRHASFVIVLVLFAFCTPHSAFGQPYYSNTDSTTSLPGAHQYNDLIITSANISAVRTRQTNAGIFTGTFGGTGFTNLSTNLFGHTYAFVPTVLANITNSVTNIPVTINTVTTTNCIFEYIGTNMGGNFMVIGAP